MESGQVDRPDAAAGGASLAVLLIAVVLLVLAAGAAVVVPPRFARIYADFEVELPGLTRLLTAVPGYVQGAALVAIAAALVAKEPLVRDNTIKLLLNLVGLLAALAFAALLVTGLFLPLISLWDKLS